MGPKELANRVIEYRKALAESMLIGSELADDLTRDYQSELIRSFQPTHSVTISIAGDDEVQGLIKRLQALLAASQGGAP